MSQAFYSFTPNTTQEIDMEDYMSSKQTEDREKPEKLAKVNIIEQLRARAQNGSLTLSKKEQDNP